MQYTELEPLVIEVWKPIDGFDYKYEISNLGRFKRLTSFHKSKIGEITTGSYDSKGYLRTTLVKNGKNVYRKMHRLVAEYFLEDYSENLTVNHVNFKKDDNRVSNLEMMSSYENIIDHKLKKVKEISYSSVLGVSFHKNLNKWTAKVNTKDGRRSIGVFNTEKDAVEAINNYSDSDIKIGKGKQNKGKRKYTEQQIEDIINYFKNSSFRKTRKHFKIGSSTLKLIINNKYFETRD